MKLKEGMVIHCNTRKKALEFLKECYKQGIYLADGRPIGDAIYEWYDFKQDTCYILELRDDKIIIRYASKEYYIDKGYIITYFDDLFKIDSKLKVGDKVRVREDLVNGEVYGGITYFNKMKNKDINTIHKVDDVGDCKINENNFWYSKEMLEKVKEEKNMSKCKVYEMPDYVRNEVKKVIVNEPCVIVILNSGEKCMAKCCPEDKFIEERGYKIALERARKEKYLNDVVRQDEIIKQYIKEFENEDSVRDYLDTLHQLYSK